MAKYTIELDGERSKKLRHLSVSTERHIKDILTQWVNERLDREVITHGEGTSKRRARSS